MKTEYEFPGGKVLRAGKGKWDVYAPDGRFLDRFPTLRTASMKAQHWDKEDAFDSLAETFACMAPLTFLLVTKSLSTMLDKEPYVPTDEEMTIAVVFDYLISLGGRHPEILEQLKDNPELVKDIIDKVNDIRRES